MRNLLLVLALAAVCLLAASVRAEEKKAEEKKAVTLKGTILCAKCALKETKKCTTAIQVKEKDKTVTYYFLDKGHDEEYHEEVCGGDKKGGSVTGIITAKEGKKYITPKKVEYAK